MKKILAVASGGGHWIQLLRLRPSFEAHNVQYVTTHKDFGKKVNSAPYVVKDANADKKFALLVLFIQMFWCFVKTRPDVVISTGAAPGFAALFWGKIFRAKTIWIDSIANAEELSSSGRKAKYFADVWLTQWSHLATEEGPDCKGKVV